MGDNFLLRDLGELLRAPDASSSNKLNEVYNWVIALPSQVEVMKKQSATLRTLFALKRETFGMDQETTEGGGAIESAIKRVMSKHSADKV